MSKYDLKIYKIGRYDIFRGKADADTWFVYDTKEKRYIGGSFDTKTAAVRYAEKQ